MTFFEKWKLDHPGPHVGMGFPPDCPHHYGYEDRPPCDYRHLSCSECWSRDIPEEVKEEYKPKTLLEKFLLDHPDTKDLTVRGYPIGCPNAYYKDDYADIPVWCAERDGNAFMCDECWQREIPYEDEEDDSIEGKFVEATPIKKPVTFLEKWKQEHPDSGSGWPSGCPSSFGYEPYRCNDEYCRNVTCVDCWNREIPEEPKADKKTIYAHMGFSEEQAEAIEEMNEGKKTPNDVREMFGLPKILDSGARREFGTGAVRDIQEGKGRCDLLPLDVICEYYYDIGLDIAFSIFELIGYFKTTANHVHLIEVLKYFCEDRWDKDCNSMFLEVSIHFEEGAKKYGENNWTRGIPVHCYIDSAVRHYLKFLRGDKDEPHDRAFCWNIMCAIWTCKHKPELNDYAKRDTSEVEKVMG